jgi:type II secretory pathway pseudopilin PulG
MTMTSSGQTKRTHGEAGYSLLLAIFMVATSLIISAAILPSVLTQGRREREAEMVWRGEQYQRAIGLYFRKFGRYPTKVDDLVKQTNGVRFLRQAYPDPMNKEDGTWRFIYVGPNGQLIGSVHGQSLLQGMMGSPMVPGGLGAGPGAPPIPPGATSGFGATTPGLAGQQMAQQQGQQPGQPTQPGQQAGQQAGGALAPDPLQSQPQPLQGAVIGGNIIGVGSKVKQSSLRVYEGGDTYEDWEFIWNPNQQVGMPGQGLPASPGPPQGLQQPPQNQQNPLGNGNVPLSTQPAQ